MKKNINGVTYDTNRATVISEKNPFSADYALHRTRDGRLFMYQRRVLVDGKLFPENIPVEMKHPELRAPGTSRETQARVTSRETIKPFTRKQALAWCIKNQIPRTFHKELARFLK